MFNYKIDIQYDGSRYKGWQKLADDDKTIQYKLENVLSLLLGEEIKVIGCSRTDAGVHAKGQIANFYSKSKLDLLSFVKTVNGKLPEDIVIKNIDLVDERFHSRYNAKSKLYSYTINNGEHGNPFTRKYEFYMDEELDLFEMKKAAKYFLGEHDFATFTNAKSKKKSMVREIYELNIIEDGNLIRVEVSGNGFLHNMVRRIVGTLIMVGVGRTESSEVDKMLKTEKRDMVKYIAEPKGLCLERIEY